MAIPMTHCFKCGMDFRSAFGSGAGGIITLSGNRETCPNCGALCRTPDGTFDLRSEFWSAVRQPGMTRQKVEAFQSSVEAVKSGTVSATEAAAALDDVNSAFATILRAVNNNGAALTLLAAIIGLFIAYFAIICANEGSAEAHRDAQKQQQVLRKIDGELERLSALAGQQEEHRRPIPAKRPPNLRQTPQGGATNRHERRKAARLAKR